MDEGSFRKCMWERVIRRWVAHLDTRCGILSGRRVGALRGVSRVAPMHGLVVRDAGGLVDRWRGDDHDVLRAGGASGRDEGGDVAAEVVEGDKLAAGGAVWEDRVVGAEENGDE